MLKLSEGNRQLDAPSQAACLSSHNTSAVVMVRVLQENNDDIQFIRGAKSLYDSTVGRIVRQVVNSGETMTPIFLHTLLRRFESMLLEGHHSVDLKSCLSRPNLYRTSFWESRDEYAPLHGDLTLLLARNIKSFSGTERAQRVKQVITMMWVTTQQDRRSRNAIDEQEGMERFFDANRPEIMRWIYTVQEIAHIHEIIGHLALAQTEQPDIGSLWRPFASQVDGYHFWRAFISLDGLLCSEITNVQHAKLIDFVCRDIELVPPGVTRSGALYIWNFLDPCLATIEKFAQASEDVEFPEDFTLHEASWVRIAKHVMKRYERTDSSTLLNLQASTCSLIPEFMHDLCNRAQHEPQTLVSGNRPIHSVTHKMKAWLQRIFQHPVKCHKEDHNVMEGHLLLHVSNHIQYWPFPVDIPTLTEFPMKGQALSPLLAVLILSDGYEELLRGCMHRVGIDERCTNQLLEMVGLLASSQYPMLAILLATYLPGYADGYYLADLAGFSICLNKALDLPNDLRATSVVPLLVSRMGTIIGDLRGGSPSEEEIARREATKAIDRLNIYLARLRFPSQTNARVLVCTRASGQATPPIGWSTPFME
jgi:hypothetical protein